MMVNAKHHVIPATDKQQSCQAQRQIAAAHAALLASLPQISTICFLYPHHSTAWNQTAPVAISSYSVVLI
jgi:hypothetical protein